MIYKVTLRLKFSRVLNPDAALFLLKAALNKMIGKFQIEWFEVKGVEKEN